VENSLRHGAGAVGIIVRSTTRGSGAMLVLEVSDEGPGIPEALVAHVFDRGVSTASSTGIGLGLARAFVEADGGRLELRRAVPPTFAIFLTVSTPPVDAESGSAVDAEEVPAPTT
jgi:signal transduction histidine kinase